jgi:hypothetical protein
VIQAIRTVAEGHTYLDPRLAGEILHMIRESALVGPSMRPKCLSDQEQQELPHIREASGAQEKRSRRMVRQTMHKRNLPRCSART